MLGVGCVATVGVLGVGCVATSVWGSRYWLCGHCLRGFMVCGFMVYGLGWWGACLAVQVIARV